MKVTKLLLEIKPYKKSKKSLLLKKKIGSGSHASVYKQNSYAIKIIHGHKLYNYFQSGKIRKAVSESPTIRSEVEITRHLSDLRQEHNVTLFLKMHDEYIAHDMENDRPVHVIVMDSGACTLAQYVFHKSPVFECSKLDCKRLVHLIAQIVFGMHSAHKKIGYIHRDFHCSNIVVEHTESTHIEYKEYDCKVPSEQVILHVIDHGCAKCTIKSVTQVATTIHSNPMIPLELQDSERGDVFNFLCTLMTFSLGVHHYKVKKHTKDLMQKNILLFEQLAQKDVYSSLLLQILTGDYKYESIIELLKSVV